MTPADLDLLREESRSGSGWASTDSLRTLLRHVDALQSGIDDARTEIEELRRDRDEWRSVADRDERTGIAVYRRKWVDAVHHVDALQAQLELRSLRSDVVQVLQVEVSMLRSKNERLTSERDAARAEVERLRELLATSEQAIARSKHDEECHPSNGRHSANCLERKAALKLLRAALSEREVAS